MGLRYSSFCRSRNFVLLLSGSSRIFNNYSSSPNGLEAIAHEAEGRMGYWLRGHEGERNNTFSKIQLVGQKYRNKTTLAS